MTYATRLATASEQNCPQIEKELMAFVFAREKFHPYVYGLPHKVVIDHKTLEAFYSSANDPQTVNDPEKGPQMILNRK